MIAKHSTLIWALWHRISCNMENFLETVHIHKCCYKSSPSNPGRKSQLGAIHKPLITQATLDGFPDTLILYKRLVFNWAIICENLNKTLSSHERLSSTIVTNIYWCLYQNVNCRLKFLLPILEVTTLFKLKIRHFSEWNNNSSSSSSNNLDNNNTTKL